MKSTIPPIRAAEYLRMSTEGQQYSIANQQAAIREYAETHGFVIVRSYADPGKSGLRAANRPGLIKLLADVQSGNIDFAAILVYDVSRWGRFQDTDESAYYEFMCRRANILVEYCGEPFKNEIDPLAAILKNIKRVMAAEYSREQSARVFRSISRVARNGGHTGGIAGYGYRRMVIGDHGEAKAILEHGQRRLLRSDRIVLVPGPAAEVRTVRRIFRLYVKKGLSPPQIADRLNAEGKINPLGRPWNENAIYGMLRNERYVGTLLYNRKSRKLRSPAKKNERSSWIRIPHAFEGIVPTALFQAAQAMHIKRGHMEYDIESLIGNLRSLLLKHGYLSRSLIKSERPGVSVYRRKFGSVMEAYSRIGYEQPGYWRTRKSCRPRAQAVDQFVTAVTEELRKRGANVTMNFNRTRLIVNGRAIIAYKTAMHKVPATSHREHWRLVQIPDKKSAFTVVIRMAPGNAESLDYILVPRAVFPRTPVQIGSRNLHEYMPYRCLSAAAVADGVLLHLG
ncbi:MAG TPA: recombinase family protein [Stellaceae bacterium]|nr:recombinase family protein [Stellaceae bacterium]